MINDINYQMSLLIMVSSNYIYILTIWYH